MMPAMRAIPRTSPFLCTALSRSCAAVSGSMMTTAAFAVAVRSVSFLVGDIDHVRLSLRASRWVSLSPLGRWAGHRAALPGVSPERGRASRLRRRLAASETLPPGNSLRARPLTMRSRSSGVAKMPLSHTSTRSLTGTREGESRSVVARSTVRVFRLRLLIPMRSCVEGERTVELGPFV